MGRKPSVEKLKNSEFISKVMEALAWDKTKPDRKQEQTDRKLKASALRACKMAVKVSN